MWKDVLYYVCVLKKGLRAESLFILLNFFSHQVKINAKLIVSISTP